MASAKSVEDMLLCSDIDESAVNALVGSLESQLSSPTVQPHQNYTRTNLSVSSNHITSSSVYGEASSANLRTLQNCGQQPPPSKHGVLLGSLLDPSNKGFPASSIGMAPNPSGIGPRMVVQTASGYTATNAFAAAQQQSLISTSPVQAARDVKQLVYTVHSSTVPTSHANTVQYTRTNIKLPNGNSSVGIISAPMPVDGLVRNGPSVLCQNTSSNPVCNPTGPVPQRPSIYQGVVPSQHQTMAVVQPSSILNSTASMQGANPILKTTVAKDSTILPQQSTQSSNNFVQGDQRLAASSPAQLAFSASTNTQTVISVPKSNAPTGSPISVVTPVMTNQHPVSSIQVLNVNPARFVSSTVQRTLAPRVVISNQVRIAGPPQVIRHGLQLPGQNAIALPPGLRGTFFVKTENGQLQVLNVSPGMAPGGASSPATGTTAYRLQAIHPGVVPSGMRTLLPQQVAVAVPTTGTAIKSIQQNTRNQSPHTVTSTVLQHTVPVSSVSSNVPRNSTPQSSVQSGTSKDFGYPGYKNDYYHYVMSSETVKQKCRNFLSTLIKLAGEQPKKVAANVKKLIQGLIVFAFPFLRCGNGSSSRRSLDGTVAPEDFTTKLQKELNSSPQPCLIPFLKKSLPFLRHSLITKEVTIEGVNPPPPTAPMLPIHTPPLSQSEQIRPTMSHPIATTTHSVTGSVLTAQLSQPANIPAPNQIINPPRIGSSVLSHNIPRVQVPSIVPQRPNIGLSPLVRDIQPKPSALRGSAVRSVASISKEKKVVTTVRDEDDINDVAAMGGVNLMEESQKILATNSELIGSQIRSCKDDNYFLTGSFHAKVSAIAAKAGVSELGSDVVALVSHAAQERLKSLIEKANLVAEHRAEVLKNDSRYEVVHDVRSKIKFLEELDRLEKKKHEEQEREILLRAAKSRSKLEDPEQLKLKQKAKEMQKAEIEELRQREANMTALLAIGPRKKLKTDSGAAGPSPVNAGSQSNSNTPMSRLSVKPRVKRVNLRDLLFVMEQEGEPCFRSYLYKTYLK